MSGCSDEVVYRSGTLPRVDLHSRFARTPRGLIAVNMAFGLLMLTFAMLSAANVDRDRQAFLAVGLGAVGGLALGQALGMTRHLLSARAAAAAPPA